MVKIVCSMVCCILITENEVIIMVDCMLTVNKLILITVTVNFAIQTCVFWISIFNFYSNYVIVTIINNKLYNIFQNVCIFNRN